MFQKIKYRFEVVVYRIRKSDLANHPDMFLKWCIQTRGIMTQGWDIVEQVSNVMITIMSHIGGPSIRQVDDATASIRPLFN